jgi:hypothetical protein
MQQLELFEPSGSPLVPVLTELEPDTMALSDWACDNFPHNYDFEVKIVNGEAWSKSTTSNTSSIA